MPFDEITPEQAFELLPPKGSSLYLDVRTEREFAQGHPAGALNVPVVFIERSGAPARPNDDFLAIVERAVPRQAEIVVGCQSGARSRRACEILAAAGYRVANLQGGFGGAKDRSGRIVAKGWRDSGLPVEEGQPAGRCYADLRSDTGS